MKKLKFKVGDVVELADIEASFEKRCIPHDIKGVIIRINNNPREK